MRLIPKSTFGLVVLALVIAGCGSSSSSSATSNGASASSSAAAASGSSPSSSSSSTSLVATALSADAQSAATGDIPDNQVFLVFTDASAGYSIKFPEGWTRLGSGATVTFRNNNNVVRVLIAHGPAPTTASVAAGLAALARSQPMLHYRSPQAVNLGSGPMVKAVYTTRSAPNAVTGKRVLLIVDRYVLARAGRVATVDLGTPAGVDNVDAYRLIIKSFTWR